MILSIFAVSIWSLDWFFHCTMRTDPRSPTDQKLGRAPVIGSSIELGGTVGWRVSVWPNISSIMKRKGSSFGTLWICKCSSAAWLVSATRKHRRRSKSTMCMVVPSNLTTTRLDPMDTSLFVLACYEADFCASRFPINPLNSTREVHFDAEILRCITSAADGRCSAPWGDPSEWGQGEGESGGTEAKKAMKHRTKQWMTGA